MALRRSPDLLVLGGGVIGMSLAWRARRRGMAVTVLERGEIGGGTSRVAAGMLAPVAEVEFGTAGRRLLDLGLRSAALWPDFAEELSEASGLALELRRNGTLLLARDADEASELERQLAFRTSLGLDVRRLAPSAARELEPALAPAIRLALEIPGDRVVDPRQVLRALRLACERDGVALRERLGEASLEIDGDRLCGVLLADGERIVAETVAVAVGPWSAGVGGLPDRARLPVRPVKGQILRLRDPGGAGLLERVVRYEGGYVVPRGDGRYVLGATVEEHGLDLGATAGGVLELLRDARELLPGVAELEIEELAVGLRPGTPDNLPAIGRGAVGSLLWATGHHRNGILLAPLTAELLLGVLDPGAGRVEPAMAEMLETCDPNRFAAHRSSPEVEAVAL